MKKGARVKNFLIKMEEDENWLFKGGEREAREGKFISQ